MNLFKKRKRKSDMLEAVTSWEISPPSASVELFSCLNIVVPENSIMYFEDVYENKVKEVLKAISTDSKTIIHSGTLWPKPDVFHVPATDENYGKIQEIAENHFISVHFHILRNDVKVLEWYDAFDKDPMYISTIIDEERIKEFCEKLGLEYRKQNGL
ncbi:MAG: hypothetical protein K8S62_07875 [Candidatus Sabulitectum sp.]|nr:hypothetical protein [Candidatus Sabulitectum sp.]